MGRGGRGGKDGKDGKGGRGVVGGHPTGIHLWIAPRFTPGNTFLGHRIFHPDSPHLTLETALNLVPLASHRALLDAES